MKKERSDTVTKLIDSVDIGPLIWGSPVVLVARYFMNDGVLRARGCCKRRDSMGSKDGKANVCILCENIFDEQSTSANLSLYNTSFSFVGFDLRNEAGRKTNNCRKG